jgi:hypothetical protein
MRNPHRVLAVAVALAALAFTTSAAHARPRPTQAERFTANKTLGLGIMLGAPTGFSGKYFMGPDLAIDGGIGAIGYYRGRDGLHLHADVLWHPVNLAKAEPFWLPLYIGVGGRIFFFDDDDDRDDDFDDDGGAAFGIRAPVGVAMDFNNVPLDVFFEVAVVLDFFVGYRDSVDVDINPAIGVRYWFE